MVKICLGWVLVAVVLVAALWFVFGQPLPNAGGSAPAAFRNH